MNQRHVASAEQWTTLVEVLRWRASQHPNRRAYTFLPDGEEEGVHLTYGEVDRHARTIGAVLQTYATRADRALLLHPPGLEFITAFFGCLYAGVIAVPAYPPSPGRPDRTLPRLRAIVSDAQPRLALTVSSLLPTVVRILEEAGQDQPIRVLATDSVSGELADAWRDPAAGGRTLAFLQYTSGSTALPKGVMVSHGNLMHNESVAQRLLEHTERSTIVSWLPVYHDMGLIGNVLQAAYVGTHCILMSPLAFLQRPIRWLRAISRHQAHTSGGPNFAYDLCVRRITREQVETLDLRCWQIAFNGAEPVRPETLERFAAAFEPCGFRREAFYPCYGLAEGTLMVSGGRKGRTPIVFRAEAAALEKHQVIEASDQGAGARGLIGCGQPVPEQEIVIVDPESSLPCLPNRIGEIWVSGPSVAQGYWNRHDETRQVFEAPLAETGQGPFLRTGDLGFLHDGELFVTGRLKDLIIIDGRNHAPQDIEATVEGSHPALRPSACAAFSVDVAGEEQLVIVAEVERSFRLERLRRSGAGSTGEPREGLDVRAIVGSIRREVAEQHDLRAHHVVLVRAGSIPKTSSGKIQRHACRASFLAGALDVADG